MNKKLITIGILLVMILFATASYSSEAPDGFQGAKFGMSIEEVKKIARKEGKICIKETEDNKILMYLFKGVVMGEEIKIEYAFTPISHKFFAIRLFFKDITFFRIKTMLVNKYGNPVKKDEFEISEKDMWIFSDVAIFLEEKIIPKAITLGYMHSTLYKEVRKEIEELDKKKFEGEL